MTIISRTKRVLVVAVSAVVLGGLLAACGAPGGSDDGGSDYPKKKIDVIVPYPAGGGADVIARAIVDEINAEDTLGQQMQIVNKPGGAGVVGITEMISSAADGYTVALSPPGPIYMHPAFGAVDYDPMEDIGYVAGLTSGGPIIAVPASSPYQSIQDLVEAAQAEPGSITMGSGPPAYQIPLAMLQKETGAQFQAVDFEGDAASLTAILGNNVDATFTQAAAILPQVQGGTVRALAVTAEERSSLLPDVPTLVENGIDAVSEATYGLYTPADAPDEVIETLGKALETALESESLQETAAGIGVELSFSSSDELRSYTKSKYEEVAGLKEEGLL